MHLEILRKNHRPLAITEIEAWTSSSGFEINFLAGKYNKPSELQNQRKSLIKLGFDQIFRDPKQTRGVFHEGLILTQHVALQIIAICKTLYIHVHRFWHITKCFLRNFYNWYIQYSELPPIYGDYFIVNYDKCTTTDVAM